MKTNTASRYELVVHTWKIGGRVSIQGAKRSKGSSKDSKAFDDEQHLEDDIKAEEKFTVRRTVAKIGAKEDTPWSKDTDYL
jgi:hypothetical protein